MHSMPSYAVFSNCLNELASSLYEQLFAQNEPLASRLVIVYDAKMKNFLYQFFARNTPQKIAMGLKVVTLSEAIGHLVRHPREKKRVYIPSRLELSMKIEQKVVSLMQGGDPDPLYLPLCAYINGGKDSPGALARKKIIALAEELSGEFSDLIMQPAEVIGQWLQCASWQQQLWKDLFSSHSLWVCAEDVIESASLQGGDIYLFALSFIPHVYYKLFGACKAHYFFFSPSEYFLEDLMSDRERVFLQKVLEGKKVRLKVRQQLDMYLRQGCPLVGNWGKVGRELLKSIASIEPFIEERYTCIRAQTLLSYLQEDIFHLCEQTMETDVLRDTSSLQLHGCPSMLREVEVLFETIMMMMSADEDLVPSDFLILTPSLSSYEPLIHQVFCQGTVQYRILDTKTDDQSDPLTALQAIFSLRERRFSLEALMELFAMPPFRKRMGWQGKDLLTIRRLVQEAAIVFGYDDKQREEILSESVGSIPPSFSYGVWHRGIERLASSLLFACSQNEDDHPLHPQAAYSLDWGDAKLLGQLQQVVSNLADDSDLLSSLTGSFSQWLDHVSRIKEKYLDKESYCPFLHQLKKMQHLFPTDEKIFTLKSFQRVLSFVLLKKRDSFQPSELESITFCSLEEGAVWPSKVICLLGMHEDSFPRKHRSNAFCDLSLKKRYTPTQQDVDRYLFLQTVVLAKRALIITYANVCEKDHKPLHPSSLVAELFTYVEKRWGAVDLHKNHPPLCFHYSYFSKGSTTHPYSQSLINAAKAYYVRDKKELAPFFPSITPQKEVPSSVNTVHVPLKHLEAFAKHPVKFFMQHVLGMYISSLFSKEEQEFVLPSYEKSRLVKEALIHPTEKVIKRALGAGYMPSGGFEKIATWKISQEAGRASSFLESLGVQAEQIKPLPLFPVKLSIQGPSGRLYRVEGVIENTCPQGLIFHGENTVEDLVKIWPTYLVYRCTLQRSEKEDGLLIFTKGQSCASFSLPHCEHLLGAYLDFFYDSLGFPSFLMPQWAEPILHADVKGMQKIIDKKEFLQVSPFADNYLRWIFLRDPPPSVEQFLSLQQKIANALFQPLLTEEENR